MTNRKFGVLGRTTKVLLDTDITHLTDAYTEHLNHIERHQGRATMIKRAKEYLSLCERYALYQPFEPLPFTKSYKDGFPRKLRLFRPYLRGNVNQQRSALSVLRIVEDMRLPISKEIGTIVDECVYDTDTIESILAFIPKWVKRISTLKLPEMDYHFTVKNGPNGPALATSDKDLGAVSSDARLFDAIQTVSRELLDDFPPDGFTTREGGIHSKLTQFPEKAGKTRTIAVVDYYSQRALRPLHRGLMVLLQTLVSDGTYSHNSVGEYAAECTKCKSFIYCADLSAFTDRFPAVIQRHLLFELLKGREQLAAAFWTLLAERQFTVAWSGDIVTYGCGQPMGAYGSWPLCTLAHHLIVEYCGESVIPSCFTEYKMIGDDLIIKNELMAQNYQKVIQSLGVCINFNKTVTSPEGATHSSAEVAKQLFLNGETLTPLTPGLMRSLKNPWLFNSTMALIVDRYKIHGDLARLIDVLFPKEETKQLVWLLATNPIDGVLMGRNRTRTAEVCIDQGWDAFTEEEVRTRFKLVRLRSLSRQAMKLYQQPLGGYLVSWASLAAGYLDIQSFTGGAWQHGDLTLEANVLSRRWILIALFNALEEMAEVDIFDVDFDRLREVEYIPDPNSPFLDLKDLRNIRRSNLFKETLESLLTEDTSTVRDDIEVPPYISV